MLAKIMKQLVKYYNIVKKTKKQNKHNTKQKAPQDTNFHSY